LSAHSMPPLSLYTSFHHRHLHSFPTRRSSDLHFPVYNDIWLYGNRDCVSLEMPKDKKGWLGLNIIYFDTSKAKPGSSVTFDNEADRKSTRLNSSHVKISYAVFCLKKKKTI